MSDLAQQIREARKNSVEVAGFTFHYNRPTQAQAIDIYQDFGGTINYYALCSRFVTGWEDVKESDCVPDGSDLPAEWNKDLWAEWISDRQDIWPKLGESIAEKYLAHEVKLDTAGKV